MKRSVKEVSVKAKFVCLSAVVAALLLGSASPRAHHAFAAEYIASEAEWNGVVTKLAWITPHVHIYMDVKERDGTVKNWGFEFPSPEQLARKGVTRVNLKVGDALTITGYPAKEGQPYAMTRTMAWADGRMAFISSLLDYGPVKNFSDGDPTDFGADSSDR
jgi:hypothetical protein